MLIRSREIFSLQFDGVYISVLTELCTVAGEPGNGTVQGDCPSTAEVCLSDGTCSLRGRLQKLLNNITNVNIKHYET